MLKNTTQLALQAVADIVVIKNREINPKPQYGEEYKLFLLSLKDEEPKEQIRRIREQIRRIREQIKKSANSIYVLSPEAKGFWVCDTSPPDTVEKLILKNKALRNMLD